MIPSVTFKRQDGNTGAAKPSVDGICVVIAPSEKGTANQPQAYTRADTAYSDLGKGMLVDFGAYIMAEAGKPVVLIKPTTATAAAYGTVTNTGPGTATPAADTSVHPIDDGDLVITFVVGGALGTAGITYFYSVDGGFTKSGTFALGTALTILIPELNAQFTLGTSTQTILAAQTVECPITGPKMTDTDITASLEALRTYAGAWECVFLAMDADSSTISAVDTWLAARENEGKFRTFITNTIPRTAAQTEAQYATALATAFNSATSLRGVVAADAAYMTSTIGGYRTSRYAALGMAARAMGVDISEDIAFVAEGPLAGLQIADDRGNPKFHDEMLYPGLDDIRLATLRSFPGLNGVFVDNPNLISPSGSDYVYWQHARVMNKACETAWALLVQRLSQGIKKDLATGFIAEDSAAEIDGYVQAGLDKALKNKVSGTQFNVSRDDDLSANSGAIITATLKVDALTYVKGFAVTTSFVKTLTVTP